MGRLTCRPWVFMVRKLSAAQAPYSPLPDSEIIVSYPSSACVEDHGTPPRQSIWDLTSGQPRRIELEVG